MSAEAIQEFYFKTSSSKGERFPLEKLVSAFLLEGECKCSLFKEVIEDRCVEMEEGDLGSDCFNKLRKFLAVNLLIDLQGDKGRRKEVVLEAWEKVALSRLEKELQLARALQSLNHYYLCKEAFGIRPQLVSEKFCFMEYKGYASWSMLPLPRLNAEIGIIWAILAYLLHDEDLLLKAIGLAEWHLNATLDHNYFPSPGFYCPEKYVSLSDLLFVNALFFRLIGVLCGDSRMKEASLRQVEHLKYREQRSCTFSSYIALLFRWVDDRVKFAISRPAVLSERIYDPNIALAVFRTKDSYVTATLMGNKTGLGSFHFKDVSIVNYGPQLFPLGDCENFGIEKTTDYKEGSLEKVFFEAKRDRFSLEGTCRVTSSAAVALSKSKSALFSLKHSGVWLDISQKYSNSEQRLEVSPYGFGKISDMAFVFYVKGELYVPGNNIKLRPRSLDSYEGDAEKIYVRGSEGEICIHHFSENREVKVTPLVGDDSFWGADFLIAYFLKVRFEKHLWKFCFSQMET